jgi:hypothetical protein
MERLLALVFHPEQRSSNWRTESKVSTTVILQSEPVALINPIQISLISENQW